MLLIIQLPIQIPSVVTDTCGSTKFNKDWFRPSEVDTEEHGHTDTETAR